MEGLEARRGLLCLHLETKTQSFTLPNIVTVRTHWITYANPGKREMPQEAQYIHSFVR